MQLCNANGVPLWAIKRAMICRINLQAQYKSFDIDKDGNVFFDGQYVYHVDRIKFNIEGKYCYIPHAHIAPI